jgi:hypothetical protein
VEAVGTIKLLKVSAITDHLVVLSMFDGQEKGVLFDVEEIKVKDGIGSIFEFTEEFLFAKTLRD